ncbi:MAG: YIP1 family protein [Planctomycetes bacterium]|nr:YIP1 family protein [Planctomycetota bacterium]
MPEPNPLSILWDPVGFTARCVDRKPRIPVAAGVVGAYVILAMIALFILSQRILGSIPETVLDAEGARKMFIFGNSVNNIFWGLAVLLLWILGAGILSSMAILLDGDADFRKVLELGGYAHFPLVLLGCGMLLFSVLYVPTLDLPRNLEVTKHELEVAVSDALKVELSSTKFRLLVSCVTCATLWQYVLWTIGIKQAGKLSYPKSAICMAALVGLLAIVLFIKSHIDLGT